MTASLAIFFAYKWYQASNLDNVYLLAPDQTLMATSTDASLARSEYEISAFAACFLEKAFAHQYRLSYHRGFLLDHPHHRAPCRQEYQGHS
jgi:hypothetical protein